MEERPPEFYQVELKLDDRKTLDRGLDSFRKMGAGYKKVLITLDCNQYDVSDDVELVNVIDWLLDSV